MNIKYIVTHCYTTWESDEWDVIKTFDNVEDAIQYHKDWSDSLDHGFLFIDVGWE